jgi:hypothetical protein
VVEWVRGVEQGRAGASVILLENEGDPARVFVELLGDHGLALIERESGAEGQRLRFFHRHGIIILSYSALHGIPKIIKRSIRLIIFIHKCLFGFKNSQSIALY